MVFSSFDLFVNYLRHVKVAEVLNVFLPVHNRGCLTALFIEHLRALVNDHIRLVFWILNDGCTDDTIYLALKMEPTAHVVNLNGNAYWGGALNKVRSLILESCRHGPSNELYMTCNDDIRLMDTSMICAISSVTNDNVVCALCRPLEIRLREGFEPSLDAFAGQLSMQRFDSALERFVDEFDQNMVNVASTYAMLTTASPWLNSEPIPAAIPHYLSDYWLTHSFWRRGFAIVHPNEFRGVTCVSTTRNLPEQSFSYLQGNRIPIFFSRIYFKAIDAASVTSPHYAPAWAKFLGCFSMRPTLFPFRRLWLFYFLGIIFKSFARVVRG